MNELQEKRKERDEAFDEFLKHASLASKHNVQARAAHHRYLLAKDEVREMERELSAFAITA